MSSTSPTWRWNGRRWSSICPPAGDACCRRRAATRRRSRQDRSPTATAQRPARFPAAWCAASRRRERRMSEVLETATDTAGRAIELDAIVIGGGLAGVYALYRLRRLGLKARAFEAGSGIGGTWFWNRYPGARCDVESMEYSYAFDDDLQQEWR